MELTTINTIFWCKTVEKVEHTLESSFGFWQINDFCSIHLRQTNIEVQITSFEKEPFHYTIPSFPVMTLDLLKVT